MARSDRGGYWRSIKERCAVSKEHPYVTRGDATGHIDEGKLAEIELEKGYRHLTVELNEYKAELAETKLRLEQARKMEALGTLTGGIVHDFNNILQAICGYTHILLEDSGDTDKDQDALLAIEKATQRAGDLITRLLVFSRKKKVEFKPAHLNQVVSETARILQRIIQKMIRIELDLEKGLMQINADSTQLSRLMMNLGVNARDAMANGGKLVFKTENVVLKKKLSQGHTQMPPGEYVRLTVSDSGHGLDKEAKKHMFDRYFTTKERAKGTGLGLSMVYDVVQSHNGHIICSDAPGQGTVFSIFFPALDRSAEETAPASKENAVPGGIETILIVDDEETMRDICSRTLKRLGYRPLSAANGETAIEVLQDGKRKIDLVILDMSMPGIGGYKCLQELIKIDPAIKVIVFSGYTHADMQTELIDSGAMAFITKPYSLKDMAKTIREVLDR